MSFISLRFKSFTTLISVFGILFVLVVPPTLSAINAPPGWQQSNLSGFGDIANKHIAALKVFGGQLYAGTWNDNGAQVWRSVNGVAWSQFMPEWSASNVAVVDMAVYQNHLYVGLAKDAAGGEVWRTDGTTWQQVITDGAGDPNNQGFLTFLTHNEKLYVATVNTSAGTQVWRSSSGNTGSWERVATNGFDGGATSQDSIGDTYGGYIYLGFRRTSTGQPELWRSADGTTWNPVFADGLGNPANNHFSAISEFNGALYIGLRNSSGGEVWISNDGTTWSPVFTGGLGKAANARPYGLTVHRQQLYVIFSNFATGAEVWRTTDGSAWTQVVGDGWGDAANGYADYFDKSAAVFNNSLFIGTFNEITGGQIWRDLHQVYLPLTTIRIPILPPTDDMISIPAGTFSMGCDGAHPGGDGFCRENFLPLHTVYLDAYRISRTEVTNARYALCVAAGVCTPPSSNSSATRTNYYGNPVYDNYPMINVTWHQAAAYCAWINGRLPTEAEWEKAARGVSDTRAYPWGDAATDCTLANVYKSGFGNCIGDTSAAGSYPAGASPFGALDMAGNVREWVNDWYSDSYYSVSPGSNPPGPETGTYKGVRGNGWYDGVPMVFFRDYGTPTNTTRITGFRCAAAMTE